KLSAGSGGDNGKSDDVQKLGGGAVDGADADGLFDRGLFSNYAFSLIRNPSAELYATARKLDQMMRDTGVDFQSPFVAGIKSLSLPSLDKVFRKLRRAQRRVNWELR